MKNKRNVLIAFILICCLCLSIGYAALTDTLEVNGTLNVPITDDNHSTDTPAEEAFDEDVHFVAGTGTFALSKTASPYTTANCSYEIVDDTYGDALDKVSVIVGAGALGVANDTVTFTVDIINASTDFAANLALDDTVIYEGSAGTYIEVTKSLDKTSLPKGGTETAKLTVVIKLKSTNDENVLDNLKFSFGITATSAA